jgi:16S rRNA (guanine(1405)-N(7))-methyltransferase
MPSQSGDMNQIVDAVLASPKYRTINRMLVERIARQEIAKGQGRKETAKAVKNKLHQVAGAYLEHSPDYKTWLEELRLAAASPHQEDLLSACKRMMNFHVSTRERLPCLEEFYVQILYGLPPIRTVLDLACGLNPLSLPWMGLMPGISYTAVDIYEDMMMFLNKAMRILGVLGQAISSDVVESLPSQHADIALLLKSIPCLEQVDKSIGVRLLDSIQARTLLISFPAHSLGGRSKGMPGYYASHFEELVAGKPWVVEQFTFRSELVFRVRKEI